MPNFKNRTLWGSEDGTFGYIEAGLPNITGDIGQNTGSGLRGGSEMSSLGSLYLTRNGAYSYNGYSTSGGSDRYDLHFDASRSNPIYGNSDTVQPPSVKVRVKTRYK